MVCGGGGECRPTGGGSHRSRERMGVKKGSSKAVAGSAAGAADNGRPFQLLNNIYTHDDIVPWARAERSRAHANNDAGSEVGGEMGDQDYSEVEVEVEGDADADGARVAETDPDLLFSPLNSGGDDDDEEDDYDNGYLSPVYFGAQYPKRFHHHNTHSTHSRGGALEQRKNSACSMPLSGLLGINEDFWKEVAMTKEESLCYVQETAQENVELGQSCAPSSDNQGDDGSTNSADTSFDEFFTEDLGNSTTTESTPSNWNEDFKIKLLCYRDGKGNFRLKTEDDYRVGKSGPAKKSATQKSSKKQKKNRDKKLLKHAIRRKSGVWEMVNTGVGIREFML